METRLSVTLLALTWALLGSCSSGGEEDNPDKGAKLANTYHLVGLQSLADLTWPVPSQAAQAFPEGTVALTGDGRFEIRLGTGTTTGPYNLNQQGRIALLVPQSGGPSLTMMGGVDREGEAFFFTDRNLAGDRDLALWTGVLQKADAKLTGGWNVAMITLLFAPASASKEQDWVAWSAAGTIQVDSSGKVTGQLDDSTGPKGSKLAITGKAAPFQTGRMDLDLEWDRGTQQEKHAYSGAVGENFFIASFGDGRTGGRVSLLLGVKVPTGQSPLHPLAGRYHLTTLTFFVNPDRAGTDVAMGSMTLNDQDAFTATLVGPYTPNGFSFRGTYKEGKEGLVDFSESWPVAIPLWGAATVDHKVMILADRTKEGNQDPDLSLFLAIREG